MKLKILTSFGFISGVNYPFKAVKLIWQNQQLWQYLIIPILINLIIGIVTYTFLLIPTLKNFDLVTNNFFVYLENTVANLPDWLSFILSITSFITAILKIILLILLLVVVGFIITQFGAVLGSPNFLSSNNIARHKS